MKSEVLKTNVEDNCTAERTERSVRSEEEEDEGVVSEYVAEETRLNYRMKRMSEIGGTEVNRG